MSTEPNTSNQPEAWSTANRVRIRTRGLFTPIIDGNGCAVAYVCTPEDAVLIAAVPATRQERDDLNYLALALIKADRDTPTGTTGPVWRDFVSSLAERARAIVDPKGLKTP